jgi:anaerobic dimethyl sulfoxide reductase subunit A
MANTKSHGETVIPTMCASHCGGSCLLNVHVKDGIITRIETDGSEEPQLRACLRGRGYRQRVYAKDRILYPLRRVGERGEGRFERISWDEALDTVAGQLVRVRDTYGPMSILYLPTAGDITALHGVFCMMRLLGLAGGYTNTWGTISFHGGVFASYFAYGTVYASNSRHDLLNSNLIIMWGWNPAVTVTGTNTAWYLAQARDKGTKIIAVDPLMNDTAATLAHEWIPIRPGTDAAMLIAMAYVMINENLQDQAFIDKYTLGFERYRDYITGVEDGEPKTPAWAEAITGVPASTIEKLAREYAATKPAALMAGTGPGRSAGGERYHQAAIALAAITGNVGVSGGDAAARAWESVAGGFPYPVGAIGGAFPMTPNPVARPPKDVTDYFALMTLGMYPLIHCTKVADAILEGKSGGFPADYKLVMFSNSNYVNSQPNINKTVKALRSKSVEFIAVQEQFMTATARFADIILPTSTYMERNDIAVGVGAGFYGCQNKIIEPLGECRSHNEIAKELASRMGIDDYDNLPAEDRLKTFADAAGIPDYDKFKAQGVQWIDKSRAHVAFEAQISDPENNPFPTPSGRIEIYSQRIADMNNPLIPPIAKYIEAWEGPNDQLAKKYPLQLITPHAKGKSNAQFANIPWIRELTSQAVLMNSLDANTRGIKNGDMVIVFNDRGKTRIPAKVTERIMPGVAVLPEGSWYDPDENGVDRAGCANVLTRDEPSPGGSHAFNTVLVEIKKA